MWAWRFRYRIVYEENDRHAACVPNVNTCATGRSPKQTAKSVPLVQLWLMGSRADGRGSQLFANFGPAGAFVVELIFRTLQLNFWHTIKKKKKRSKQCCHEHYHALMLVVTHSPHPLIELCVFPNSVSHRRRRRAGNVKKSLRPATNVPLTETNTPSSSRIPYTDCYICKWCFLEGKMDRPWAAAGARCWDVSTPRWFPCFYGSPSGSPSSVWTAAWGRILATFIRFSIHFRPCSEHNLRKYTN